MAVVRPVFDRPHDRGGVSPARRRIGHHLLFASDDSIETVVRQLQRQRFDVEVWRNEDGRCTIVAAHLMTPESAVMELVTEFFEALARDHAGEYAGWIVSSESRT
jgi:hypothetical protein